MNVQNAKRNYAKVRQLDSQNQNFKNRISKNQNGKNSKFKKGEQKIQNT
jgi:hypothetical protein